MKTPERMCCACRVMKDKRELLRVVRNPAGEIMLDNSGKLAGRGAYLCPDKACLQKAKKARSLEKALKTKMPDEIWEMLAGELPDE